MITVYGAEWCEDTRRTLRHLRRLGLAYEYHDIDEDLALLERAMALAGRRRTPVIDLGLGGDPLVEPDNDTLTAALVEIEMLSRDDADERMGVQNVGDVERIARTLAGAAVLAVGATAPRGARWPFGIMGTVLAITGLAGWCPVYYRTGVTSLGGPGDRPDEAHRTAWLASQRAPAADAGAVAKRAGASR
jgi:mycoredoxin